jgi:hypothetical protein
MSIKLTLVDLVNVAKVRDTINTSKHSAVTSAMLSSAPDHTMFPTGVWKVLLMLL